MATNINSGPLTVEGIAITPSGDPIATTSVGLTNSGFEITLEAPTLGADYTLTLPVDDGTVGQVLTTNGLGVLTWTTPGGAAYTVYTALLTQTGTNAPVATILTNTTGATLTWARTSAGLYTVTSSVGGLFIAAKTLINPQSVIWKSTLGYTFTNAPVANTTTILTFYTAAVTFEYDPEDVVLINTFIEIRIYP